MSKHNPIFANMNYRMNRSNILPFLVICTICPLACEVGGSMYCGDCKDWGPQFPFGTILGPAGGPAAFALEVGVREPGGVDMCPGEYNTHL